MRKIAKADVAISVDECNAGKFLAMLAWLELCSNIGHSCDWFKARIDGDGAARIELKFKNKEDQKHYDELKKKLLSEYENKGKDLECFEFE